MLQFNKIFFPDNQTYLSIVWPANMLIVGLASIGIFKDRSKLESWFKNILFAITAFIPFVFETVAQQPPLMYGMLIVYVLYYVLLLVETLRQISNPEEVTLSVLFGSFCGYLLLVLVALFSFLLVEYHCPKSFHGLTGGHVGEVYSQMSYFSFVAMTTIGFGDIYPESDSARLLTAFFAVLGQFYMVGLVGILISRFTGSPAKK
jgi:hypothetical protein